MKSSNNNALVVKQAIQLVANVTESSSAVEMLKATTEVVSKINYQALQGTALILPSYAGKECSEKSAKGLVIQFNKVASEAYQCRVKDMPEDMLRHLGYVRGEFSNLAIQLMNEGLAYDKIKPLLWQLIRTHAAAYISMQKMLKNAA